MTTKTKPPIWLRLFFPIATRLGWVVSFAKDGPDYHFMLNITKPKRDSDAD